MSGALLSARDLTVSVGGTTVVHDFALELGEGEAVSIVGESGAGKTTALLALLRLLPDGFRTDFTSDRGGLRFRGRDLLALSESALRSLRGREIGVVFQEPAASLNPLIRVGEQIAEVLRHHEGLDRRAAAARAVDLVDEVGIERPGERARAFPHELSGGMCQRVAIAMAVACEPGLLVADEPTASLDVTVQREILELFRRLTRARGTGLLFVTHDLGVAFHASERALVMQAGRVVEEGPVEELFRRPSQAYTRSLLDALPERLDLRKTTP